MDRRRRRRAASSSSAWGNTAPASSTIRATSTSSRSSIRTAPGSPEGVEPSAFWVRIVRQLVTLLQERTADGYVFRIDLRLRPDPGATRVAISAPAALLYYESMGQNWERAALIKARAVAGDIAAGEALHPRARAVHLAQISRLRGDRRHPFDQAAGACASRPRDGRACSATTSSAAAAASARSSSSCRRSS